MNLICIRKEEKDLETVTTPLVNFIYVCLLDIIALDSLISKHNIKLARLLHVAPFTFTLIIINI